MATVVINDLEVAAALRIGDGTTALEEPLAGVIGRLRAMAVAMVERRAPNAPDAVKQEAVIRLASYVYDFPESPRGSGHAAIFRNSGAAHLLSSWVPRRVAGASDA